MGQRTTLAQGIDIVAQKAQYDAACKKLLAEKIILAWIMKHTMKEYEAYDVWEIVKKYIVGKPKIGETPVMPDETNEPKIVGIGVEDSYINEGKVTYDIQFRAILPDTKENVQMIVNIEAQNDFYPGYPIIKRGIYYCARMISSQYGTVFTDSHYERIQKVYSVWICMNPPKERNNSITEYSLAEKNVTGMVREKTGCYDLLTMVMICLGKCEETEKNGVLRLLDVLLSSDISAKEKKEILENDFDIPMTKKIQGEVESMCNLSDGVEWKGMQKGMQEGIMKTLCDLVRDNLLAIEEAARRAGMTVEEFAMELNKQ